MYYFVILFALLAAFLVIRFFIKLPGYKLARKFKRVGDVSGLDLQDIINEVGMFKSSRSLLEGQKIYAWHEPGYRITIVFDRRKKAINVNTEKKTFQVFSFFRGLK